MNGHPHPRCSMKEKGISMTKEIELSQGKVALIDDADYEWLSQWKWCASRRGNLWYAVRTIRLPDGTRRPLKMHRLITNAPPDRLVDHIDCDGLNNQRSNLRFATMAQNIVNSPSVRGISKYRGVTRNKRYGTWDTQIRTNGRRKWIGSYKTEVEAALAYDAAAREAHGEFARLNFP